MTTDVLFSQKKQLGIITLNRPQALNALTLPMIQAIQQQLHLWQSDDSVQAVIIQAEGEKAFCAGGDVRWLYEKGRQQQPQHMSFFWHEYRLNYFIHHYPKPYIALLNGITMGGGVGVSLHGSHPIASEQFKFAMPETTIGFFPDIGASHLLTHCPGEIGTYLGLTGNRLNAQEAAFCGLVKGIVANRDFPQFIEQLSEASFEGDAFKTVDQCIQSFALHQEEHEKPTSLHTHLEQITHCFSCHSMEEILLALQQTAGEWGSTISAQLLAKSPLSLKITLEQLRRAKGLSMSECIKMDYGLVAHFMSGHDFYEGVRALLIDKDQSPQWQPPSLEKVMRSQVVDYFECDHDELSLASIS